MHKALLRFRSNKVALLTGIDFKKVLVRKAIFLDGKFVPPDIRSCNMYSEKVIGRIVNRSIWDLDPVERYVAPEDFYQQLIEAHFHRIIWGCEYNFSAHRKGPTSEEVISTAPLPIVLGELDKLPDDMEFGRSPIYVARYRIENASGIYQTIYFPGEETAVYRASITDDLLIVEAVIYPFAEIGDQLIHMPYIMNAFGISDSEVQPLGAVQQKYGKIANIDGDRRKAILYDLTLNHGIYSLGRFATHNNILLDDVVDDIKVIKQLMVADAYALKLRSI